MSSRGRKAYKVIDRETFSRLRLARLSTNTVVPVTAFNLFGLGRQIRQSELSTHSECKMIQLRELLPVKTTKLHFTTVKESGM